MSKEKWFLGSVSRQVAEDAITSCGIDGSFVFRSSESVPGAYALSVFYGKQVHTYRVLPTDKNSLAVQTLGGVQQRRFSTLDDLVKEYKSPQNGLICALTNPVGLADNHNAPQLPAVDFSLPNSRLESSNVSPAKNPNIPNHQRPIFSPPGRPKVSPVPMPRQNESAHLEKQKELPANRNLPPLPQRDSSQRPPLKNQQGSAEASSPEVNIKNKLLSRFNEIQTAWAGTNDAFLDALYHYASEGELDSDIASVRKGGEHCTQLQTLLAKEAVAFQSELELFLMKTDILRQLFDFNVTVRKSHASNRIQNLDVDLDTFLIRLRDCQTVVKALDKRVCLGLKSSLGLLPPTSTLASDRKLSRAHEIVTERIFEVKQDGGLKISKQKLKMDLAKGTVSIIKGDDVTEYNHSKVLQIIKNNKAKNKLSILFDGVKKKDFTFEESSQREAFCQLMQHIRSKDQRSPNLDCISVFCGSWNMGDAIPPSDISSWFMCNGTGKCLDPTIQSVPHDIYVLGTQETGLPERDWMHKVLETLQDITGANFHLVVMDALWHIKIMVFVKEEHKNRISHVQTSTVKTGIANALGNKGAVAVTFQFECTSFCFINAHLTSGAEKCARRNQNYHDIVRSLNLGEDRFSIFGLTNRFDHLFFFGDLNYRLEMEASEIFDHIKKKELSILTKADQLRREKNFNKVFSHFYEDEILFPPTYRYERGTREVYSHLKVKKTGVRINVPSWCDRVLWRSYPETHNVCHAYGCSDDIMTSDHSPVFSNFQVGVRGQYVSNEEISSGSGNAKQGQISFDNFEIVVKSPGKSFFYLQFHSLCLESYVRSGRNSKLVTSDVSFNQVRLTWNSDSLPKLHPIISDRAFLDDQHLLICLRNEDDNDVIGECVVALKGMTGFQQQFETVMSRKGEDMGLMQGRMTVFARESKRAPREKTYDFIQIRKDEDESKTRRDIVAEVGTYSAVEDVQPQSETPKQRHPMRSPQRAPMFPVAHASSVVQEVAVYGETDLIEENQYADPDEVKAGPSPPVTPTSGRNFQFSKASDLSRPFPAPRSMTDVSKVPDMSHSKIKSGLGSPVSALLRLGSPKLTKRRGNGKIRPHSSVGLMEDHDFSIYEHAGTKPGSRTPPHLHPPPRRSPSPPFHSSNSRLQDPNAEPPYDRLANTQQIHGSFAQTGGGKQFSPTTMTSSPLSCLEEARGSPTTVEEFLSLFNMNQYTSLLEKYGWDSIEFLGELTEDDLYEIGVVNLEHCQIILDAIQGLNMYK